MFCLLLNVKLTGQGVFGGKSMAHKLTKVSALALAAAWLAAAPALAESAMQQLQGVQQQSDKAQRNPSLEGAKKQSGQGIDTKGSYAAPVGSPSRARWDNRSMVQVAEGSVPLSTSNKSRT